MSMLRTEGDEEVIYIRFSLVLISLAAIIAAICRMPGRDVAGTEALKTVLRTAGAEVVKGEVQYYALISRQFLSLAELEDIAQETADLLGLNERAVQRETGDTYRVVRLVGSAVFGSKAHIVAQSNPEDRRAGLLPQTYLLVICRDTSADNIEAAVKRLENRPGTEGDGGRISFYLTGEIAGKHTREEMKAMAGKALAAVRGRLVEGMIDESVISITAYTPLLDEYIILDKERFNLNLAVRYDQQRNVTVFWAGSPVIHSSY